MATKAMDLQMRITAQGAQAMRELSRVAGAVRSVGQVASGIGHAASTGFSLFSRAASMVFAPLRLLTGGGVLGQMTRILGAVQLARMGKDALSAAGDVETFIQQMTALTGSARAAAAALAEVEQVQDVTPFDDDQLRQAKVALAAMGQVGKRDLQVLADAAGATGQSIEALVQMLANPTSERGLRRLGISADADGERFVMSYRNTVGQVVKVSGEGAEQARKALLGIFAARFSGGGLQAMGTWAGITAQLGKGLREASEQFGRGLLPTAKAMVQAITSGLSGVLEGGKIEAAGKRFGEMVTTAMDYVAAVVGKTTDTVKALREVGAGGMAEAFGVVAMTAAKIFAAGVIEYLMAAKDLFLGIGKLLVAPLREWFLQNTPLAARAGALNRIEAVVSSGTPDDAANTRLREIIGNTAYEQLRAARTPEERGKVRIRIVQNQLTHEQRVALAMGDISEAFENAGKQALNAIPDAVRRLDNKVAKYIAEAAEKLGQITAAAGGTGPTVGERAEARRQDRETAQAAENTVIVRAERQRRESYRDGAEIGTRPVTDVKETRAAPGEYSVGQKLPGGYAVTSVQTVAEEARARQAAEARARQMAIVRGYQTVTGGYRTPTGAMTVDEQVPFESVVPQGQYKPGQTVQVNGRTVRVEQVEPLDKERHGAAYQQFVENEARQRGARPSSTGPAAASAVPPVPATGPTAVTSGPSAVPPGPATMPTAVTPRPATTVAPPAALALGAAPVAVQRIGQLNTEGELRVSALARGGEAAERGGRPASRTSETPGAVTINISKLEVRANNLRQLQDDLISRGQRALLPVAAT